MLYPLLFAILAATGVVAHANTIPDTTANLNTPRHTAIPKYTRATRTLIDKLTRSIRARDAGTGCSCAPMEYTDPLTDETYYVIYPAFDDSNYDSSLIGLNEYGVCFVDGSITQRSWDMLDPCISTPDGIAGIDCPVVNGTWARHMCSQLELSIGECTSYVVYWYHYSNIEEGEGLTECSDGKGAPAYSPFACNCQWDCGEGYHACGDSCIADGEGDCPSSVPAVRKRQSLCKLGFTQCPVGKGQGWECLDTTSTLEACGGCPGEGQDCSAIPGAGEVSCVNGECVVESCGLGWVLRGGVCEWTRRGTEVAFEA